MEFDKKKPFYSKRLCHIDCSFEIHDVIIIQSLIFGMKLKFMLLSSNSIIIVDRFYFGEHPIDALHSHKKSEVSAEALCSHFTLQNSQSRSKDYPKK